MAPVCAGAVILFYWQMVWLCIFIFDNIYKKQRENTIRCKKGYELGNAQSWGGEVGNSGRRRGCQVPVLGKRTEMDKVLLLIFWSHWKVTRVPRGPFILALFFLLPFSPPSPPLRPPPLLAVPLGAPGGTTCIYTEKRAAAAGMTAVIQCFPK